MFNFLGKTLVILFGFASILCLMGAVAVKTQKMDYVTPRGGEAGKKTMNRVDEARAKTKELLAANQRAVTRLNLEMEPVVEIEADLLKRRDYYYAQLQMMQTGKWYGKDVTNPIQVLPQYAKDKDKDKDDYPLLKIHTDKDKPPALDPVLVIADKMNQPVHPASYYLEKIQKLDGDIDMTTKAIKQLIADHAKSTVAINGAQGPPVIIGLRERIKDQIKIKEDAIAETEFLDDPLTRRQAEAELFVKRRDAMIDRLAELKKFFRIQNVPAVPGN